MSEVDKELQEYIDENYIVENLNLRICEPGYTINVELDDDPNEDQVKAIRLELYRFAKKVSDILEG